MPKQHFLKSAARTAGTRVVTTKFFDEFFVAMHDPETAFDVRFGRKSFAALATALAFYVAFLGVAYAREYVAGGCDCDGDSEADNAAQLVGYKDHVTQQYAVA